MKFSETTTYSGFWRKPMKTPILSKHRTTEILKAVQSFMRDRRSRSLAPRSIEFYEDKLHAFLTYVENLGIEEMDQLTPDVIRTYLLTLEEKGHKPGGIMTHYRAVKALCRFWVEETETFRDPFVRVKPPKVVIKPIPGIPVEDVMKMVHCTTGRNELRDRAILLTLLDTGARKAEMVAINVGDVDLENGVVTIWNGKGGRKREVFIGKKTRRAIRRYLKDRRNPKPHEPLWANEYGDRLAYSGLRMVIARRARDAGLEKEPGLHDFRRAFCLAMHRNGADNISISRQLGHASLEVMKRYLDQSTQDHMTIHEQCSPVDRAD
jgi:site-specific recombinase XerD